MYKIIMLLGVIFIVTPVMAEKEKQPAKGVKEFVRVETETIYPKYVLPSKQVLIEGKIAILDLPVIISFIGGL